MSAMSTTRPLTWLITGCSSGFGLSLALSAAAAGHRVIATSRAGVAPTSISSSEEGADKIAAWYPLDVTDREAGPRLIRQLEAGERKEKIDVLVNNAGGSIFAPVETSTEDEVREQMETMYFGPLRLIRAVLPGMRARGSGGTVVNISSGASLEGAPTMGPYAGAKGALDAVSKVLNKEVAPFNIKILTVVLGTFNTNFDTRARLGEVPMPEGYRGTVCETLLDIISNGKLVPNGDKDKAMRALLDVVTDEQCKGEKLLLLGPDMISRAQGNIDLLSHALDRFGDVARSVAAEK